MGAGVRSVVDIGSNSIKLRVARYPAGRIEVLLDTTEVVRLGRRTADGRLRREAIRNGVRVVEETASAPILSLWIFLSVSSIPPTIWVFLPLA